MRTKRHILAVDDDPNLLRTMQYILEVANYHVTAATSCEEALNIILRTRKDRPFDLLITDIQMSPLSGLELIDELRRRRISLPALVISAYGNKMLSSELEQRGCQEVIEKPFDAEELTRRVCLLFHQNQDMRSERSQSEFQRR